ncbi:hypothetical protein [Yersinia bercovieri]|uniref:hypothetical protein n=1 Tax=Yersinia bercovieri TaxID=634 RepID=UPI0005DFC8DA|nr:hypothetical protein [Yersinia bercovieri]MDN0104275.1 hypothetical protein [Yersinia bercovieri]CNI78246.1 Uncharacterised protein [Yersinia bercovieri]
MKMKWIWILRFVVMVIFASSTVVYSAPVTKEIKVEATISSILELDIVSLTKSAPGDVIVLEYRDYNGHAPFFMSDVLGLKIRHNSDAKQGYNLSINDDAELTTLTRWGRWGNKGFPMEVSITTNNGEKRLLSANPVKINNVSILLPGNDDVVPLFIPLSIKAIPGSILIKAGELYTGILTFTLEPLS